MRRCKEGRGAVAIRTEHLLDSIYRGYNFYFANANGERYMQRFAFLLLMSNSCIILTCLVLFVKMRIAL
jgi:hypothetical protein